MNNQHFFYRTAVFSRKEDQIALANINAPGETSPLDDWLGIVFSLADGQHSIGQLFDYMVKQYPQAPTNLEKTLISVIDRLIDGKIIAISDVAIELPYYLSMAVEELDIDKARLLMAEDGYAI